MSEPNYHDLLYMLAREAGELIRASFFAVGSDQRQRWKESGNPVTEVELRLNYLAVAFVRQYFPDHNVLGEDERDVSHDTDYMWVFDPIDGTLGFSHGIPTCVFSMSLTKDGQVIVASIYDPFMERFFFAEKGQGASMNRQPIRVSESTSLIDRVVGIGGGHGQTLDLGRLHNYLRAKESKVVNIYSTLYMAALVANGEFAGVIYGGDDPFDGAAAKLIIEEAGGTVSSLEGAEQRYDRDILGFVASNGAVQADLLQAVRETASPSPS